MTQLFFIQFKVDMIVQSDEYSNRFYKISFSNTRMKEYKKSPQDSISFSNAWLVKVEVRTNNHEKMVNMNIEKVVVREKIIKFKAIKI